MSQLVFLCQLPFSANHGSFSLILDGFVLYISNGLVLISAASLSKATSSKVNKAFLVLTGRGRNRGTDYIYLSK